MKKMPFAIIFLLALTVVANSVSLAFAQEGTELPGLEPIYEIFKAIGYSAPIAVLVGLFTCFIGYLKSTPPEEFKLVNFIYTFLISLIIGIATIYGGWTYAEVEQWLGNGALTLYIYWIAKIIAKKLEWVTQTASTTGPGPPAA